MLNIQKSKLIFKSNFVTIFKKINKKILFICNIIKHYNNKTINKYILKNCIILLKCTITILLLYKPVYGVLAMLIFDLSLSIQNCSL